jgi:hypothetical protein
MDVQVANIDNWTIESRSPGIANLQMHPAATSPPAGTSTRNRISLDATFGKDEAPLVLKVSPQLTTLPTALTFELDPKLINHTGFEIFSSNVSLVDGTTIPATTPTHSPYAHFHDANSIFPNWENPTIGPFETYFALNNTTGTTQNINGANDIRLSGGSTGGLNPNDSASLTGFGIHQFLNEPGAAGNGPDGTPGGNGGAFYIVLTAGGGAGQDGKFDQVIEGDDRDNTLVGDASHAGSPIALNDLVLGYDGDDTITTGLGNDTVVAGPGDDTIDTDGGNNYILGGPGSDTAIYHAPRALFTVSNSLFSDFTISGAGAFDAVTDVEYFKFSDVTLSRNDLIAGVPSAMMMRTPHSTPAMGCAFAASDLTALSPQAGMFEHS